MNKEITKKKKKIQQNREKKNKKIDKIKKTIDENIQEKYWLEIREKDKNIF